MTELAKLPEQAWQSATDIATAVTAGSITARAVVEAAVQRIASRNGTLNAFTDITADRARARAIAHAAERAAGRKPGPLAGVPFAVKNLFDIEGLATRAGSAINRDLAPAARDAGLVTRLERAGELLLDGCNMGEFASDSTAETRHDGPSRNPHDTTRMSGGSSGGTA